MSVTNYLLIRNPKQILTMASRSRGPRRGKALGEIGLLPDGWGILVQGEKIAKIGRLADFKGECDGKRVKILDASGKVVLPGFVDSHTHAVFAEPRLVDFELRNRGVGYQEIAKRGGGILSSVEKVRRASRAELTKNFLYWCERALELGTTTMEVKSGYGLSVADEEKMLLAIREAQRKTPLDLVATFMGAHAVPREFKKNPREYVDLVIREMLPRFRQMAEFVDVFCEKGYFERKQAEEILRAAKKLGYKLKIHAEQITRSGGGRLAAEVGCQSADHLDKVGPKDIELLAKSQAVCALVPGSNFFLKTKQFPPARILIDAGCAVALASDFNPGTCPTLNMSFIISLAVLYLSMTPEEAIVAATINGAWALGRAGEIGSLEPGKQADMALFEISDYREIPYYFGMNLVGAVIKKGQVVYEKNA